MVAEPEFFVSDPSGTLGPLTAEALREALRDRSLSDVMVRAAGSATWLPAFAWEAASEAEEPPGPPPLPAGGPRTVLPQVIAELKPKTREKLRWFVSDADGIRGPFSGEIIREGLASGKIAPVAKLCMIASQEWVRAAIVFPRVGEGTTAARTRPFEVVPCAFCLEPIAVTDKECTSCGEPVERSPELSGKRIAALVALVLVSLFGLGVGAATLALYRGGGAPSGLGLPPPAGAEPLGSSRSTPAAASGALGPAIPPPDSAARAEPSSPGKAAKAAGHLEGEVTAKMDVPSDTADVLSLPRDRIAVARKESVEVIDARSGAPVFTVPELRGLRALYPVGEAIYGLSAAEVAVIEPATVRARKWIALGAPPGVPAVSRELTLVPLAPSEGLLSVAVIDAGHRAAIETFRFEERISSVAVDAKGQLGVAVTSDARAPRPSEDAVLLFDPSRLASAQPLRRVHVGPSPVAAAVAPSGAVAAVALLGSAELARVDLTRGSGADPAVTRQKTCAEPIVLSFVAASGQLLVGCRSGRAVALHDGASLAQTAQIDLGGPLVGLDVSPDGQQALLVVGAPAASVGVLDLGRPSFRRLAVSDEIASARYGQHSSIGLLFSPRAHRLWVLR